MTAEILDIGAHRVLVAATEGPTVRYRQAVDLIGDALAAGAGWVAIPAVRLGPDFFRLRTGVAGEVAQKFVTYGRGLAVVGDVSAYAGESGALRDFIRESNRGAQVWFVDSFAELEARLGGT